ncbi:MAG: hypothetical protein FJY56_22450, partial [Betaproteobacteria bacterium]|nr:hypothetical protein [Betaproteobacteria bacterium]
MRQVLRLALAWLLHVAGALRLFARVLVLLCLHLPLLQLRRLLARAAALFVLRGAGLLLVRLLLRAPLLFLPCRLCPMFLGLLRTLGLC